MTGRHRALAWTGAGLLLALGSVDWPPEPWLVWNRTASAPIGLYRVVDRAAGPGDFVIVRAQSAAAKWASAEGSTGRNWPLLKRVYALPGAQICRDGAVISVDAKPVALALDRARSGRRLPVWAGCRLVGEGQVFLLNAHPASLDGRYFGVTDAEDVSGVAVPLFVFSGL